MRPPMVKSNRAATAILVCVNQRLSSGSASCGARGAEGLAAALEAQFAERKVDIAVRRIYCFGRCAEGPNLRLVPAGRFFRGATPADLPAIVEQVVDDLDALNLCQEEPDET